MSTNLKKEPSSFLIGAKKALSKIPAPAKWLNLPRVLNKKERVLFFFFLFLASASSIILLRSLYLLKTHVVPASAGTLREGEAIQPRFINPVLASSETDRGLVELTFSGLMKYGKDGSIELDMAEEVATDPEQGTYEVTLRDDLLWSDGERITAEDVIFTVNLIQDPAYKSPKRPNWIGVETEMVSNRKVRFILEEPYYPFRERLTLKIIPKHIFKDVPTEEFALSSFNLAKAVSSGPFKVEGLTQNEAGGIQTMTLRKNDFYHGKKANLREIVFYFFNTEEELHRALKKDKVDAAALSDLSRVEELQKNGVKLYSALSPRYFGIFLNPEKNEVFKKEEVRKALSFSIDRERIVAESIADQGRETTSPVLPSIFGFEQEMVEEEEPEDLLTSAGYLERDGKWTRPSETQSFTSRLEAGSEGGEVENLQKCLARFEDVYPEGEVTGYFGAKTEKAVIRFQEKYKEEILDPWNFTKGTGIVSETTRKKLNEVCTEKEDENPLSITITTVDQPFLEKTAELVKENWEDLGLEVEIEKYDFATLSREKIKTRDYEALLFGEMLGLIPDPYPFWHSSRIKDPGLNLAFYESEDADKYLEEARTAKTREEFEKNLVLFQKTFAKDQPSVILFSPKTCYLASSKIKGIDFEILTEPSQRFEYVEDWYIKSKRVLK